jgi:hypothetical protein
MIPFSRHFFRAFRLAACPRFLLLVLLLGASPALRAEPREWTDSAGNKVTAEYIKSTEETVTVRLPNLKTMEVPLGELSEADREFVQQQREREKEENEITVSLKGEIAWRLSNQWRSMSLTNQQSAELWTWDEEAKKPKEKLTTFTVNYNFNFQGAREEVTGTYETEKVTFDKNSKLVIVAIMRITRNNKPVEAKDTSIPMSVPADATGSVRLPTARASAR